MPTSEIIIGTLIGLIEIVIKRELGITEDEKVTLLLIVEKLKEKYEQ